MLKHVESCSEIAGIVTVASMMSPCDDSASNDRVAADGCSARASLEAAPQHTHPIESDVAGGPEDRRRQRHQRRVDADRRPLSKEKTGAANAHGRDRMCRTLRVDQTRHPLPLRRSMTHAPHDEPP